MRAGCHENFGPLVWPAIESAADEAIDELGERDPRVLRRFGEKTDGREAGHGVDFEQVGVQFLIEHDVDAREIAMQPDDTIGCTGKIATIGGHFIRQSQIEAMLRAGGFVLCVEIEEFVLGDDADRSERLIFEQADGELRALDEAFDHCVRVRKAEEMVSARRDADFELQYDKMAACRGWSLRVDWLDDERAG